MVIPPGYPGPPTQPGLPGKTKKKKKSLWYSTESIIQMKIKISNPKTKTKFYDL